METPDTIQEMVRGGPNQRLAFLSGEAAMREIGQTLCALLNSGGGQILVGVDPHGKPTGVAMAEELEKTLHPLSGGNEANALLTPNAVWDVSDEPVGSERVVLIDVPAGSDLPYVFEDTIYIRSGITTRPATGSEVRALIEKRYQQGARWERQPALDITIDDLDQKEILETARIASERRGWRFHDSKDTEAILRDLNLVQDGRLTHAAVVLFAKEAGFILPQAHVRMTAYRSDKGDSEYTEDKECRGHLFSLLQDYDAFIQRHVTVMSELSASKQERVDRPRYPYWSLREGFRNALMHRDYSSIHGRISVGIYPQKIELWSFGHLPAGLTDKKLKEADRSLPVNPDIAQVVFLRGLVELLGRGTRKIAEEFESHGLPEPKWRKQSGGITLTLRSRSAPGEAPAELNRRQIALIRSLRPGAGTDLGDYQKMHEALSERTVRNDLSLLVKLGYLARMGQGKATHYVRTEKPSA
ncbi:MAG: RNA-binding domain-containing protein [Puniceicoccaceae bacterium]